MTLEILLLIVFGAFLALVLLEVPIALAIGASGFLGIVLLNGSITAAQVLATMPFSGTAKYGLFVIPMYILLGTLIANAGIGAGIYRAANRFVRRLPGGLAATAVIATSLFSGISGSSAADVATFGRISVNEMTKFGYSRAYAAAVVAAAGAFAALIPPSIALVLYAIIAEVSVGAMIIAGVVPGILSAVVLSLFVIVNAALKRPGTFANTAVATSSVATQGGQASARHGSTTLLEPTRDDHDRMLDALQDKLVLAQETGTGRRDAMAVLYAAIIFLIVIGGLYAGIFTATESGAIGAFAALVIALVAKKSREMPLRQLIVQSLKETASVTSMIFLLLIGGAIFAFFVASSGAPRMVTQWATSLPVDPLVVVALLLLVLLVLGMFLDGLTILLLTVPLIAPIVTGLGFDGIWFGILVLKVIEIGLITPPVGINCFIISGIAKVPVAQVFVRLIPFVVLDIALVAVLVFFPEIILFLPRAAGLL